MATLRILPISGTREALGKQKDCFSVSWNIILND